MNLSEELAWWWVSVIDPQPLPAFTINPEATKALQKSISKALRDLAVATESFINSLRRMRANDASIVLRVGVREQVRGAMLDNFELMNQQRVQLILSGAMPETRYMTPGNRAYVAAQVIRGYVEHHDGELCGPSLIAHRWDEAIRTAIYIS